MRLVPAVQRQFRPQHCMYMQQKILQLQRQQQQRISLSAMHLHSINTSAIPDQQKLCLCTLQQKPAINGNFAASSMAFQQQRLCPSGSIQQCFSSSNTLKAAAFQLHQHQCSISAQRPQLRMLRHQQRSATCLSVESASQQHELQQCSAPQQQHSFSTCAICNNFISNDGICDICPRHLHLPQYLRQHRLQHLFNDTDNICDVSAFDNTACTFSSSTSVVSATATALRASSAAGVLSSGICHGLRTYATAATSDFQRQRLVSMVSVSSSNSTTVNSATAAALLQLQHPRCLQHLQLRLLRRS